MVMSSRLARVTSCSVCYYYSGRAILIVLIMEEEEEMVRRKFNTFKELGSSASVGGTKSIKL